MEMQTEPSLSFAPIVPVGTTPVTAGLSAAAPAPVTGMETHSGVLDSLKSSGQAPTANSTQVPLSLAPAIHAAWLTGPAPPLVDAGPVVTISDRRVRLAPLGAAEQPSLYKQCRQWVQNDPDLADFAEPIPTSKLPPLPPLSQDAAAALQQPAPQALPLSGQTAGGLGAGGSGSGDVPAIDVLLQHHKEHWAAVRQHRQEQTAAGQQRFAMRLQEVLTLGGMPAMPAAAAGAVPMQQQ